MICTRSRPGDLSVGVGNSSRCNGEIVKFSNCAFQCDHYYHDRYQDIQPKPRCPISPVLLTTQGRSSYLVRGRALWILKVPAEDDKEHSLAPRPLPPAKSWPVLGLYNLYYKLPTLQPNTTTSMTHTCVSLSANPGLYKVCIGSPLCSQTRQQVWPTSVPSIKPKTRGSLKISVVLSTARSSKTPDVGPPRWPSGKASASRAEGPGFESRLSRDFFRGRVIPVT